TSDKSSWIVGAYVGFVRGKGDCFNFFAVAKALLNRAGIETVDLERIPSKTRHYWLLANIGTGWYHFDACPHPTGYPLQSFFLTEQEVRDYSQEIGEAGVRENYFIYDYANCFVKVEGTPEGAETEYGWYLLENGLIEDPNGETAPDENGEQGDTPDETGEPSEQNEQIDTPDETGGQNEQNDTPDETGDGTGPSEENGDQTPEGSGEADEGEPGEQGEPEGQ
ncbi:MAG: hypothetical protein IKX91_03995, partial [Firmicutes bacterium]|nr:hypothetical protein [Bacillota bacterium]